MSLELYVFPPSPRAFKALAVANHLGIEYRLKPVNLFAGEHRTPEYAALNPNMKMPVLKDGDFVLWESNAIIQYLALKRPESGLLPLEDPARLDVTRWQFWDLAHWDPACATFIFENLVKGLVTPGAAPDPAALAKGEELFHRFAKVLEGHLAGREYISGDRLTVADFSLGAALNLSERARLPTAPYPEIRRWHASLRELPAWAETEAASAMPQAA
ncbi:MAG TPA: glutathione S-transferase family protein [Stellaceae bacterium]|nr:glutathione S-transferase family protein [Stellaceae bacterium]